MKETILLCRLIKKGEKNPPVNTFCWAIPNNTLSSFSALLKYESTKTLQLNRRFVRAYDFTRNTTTLCLENKYIINPVIEK